MSDHVVIEGDALKCRKCQAREDLKLPVSATDLLEQLDTFIEAHKGCAA